MTRFRHHRSPQACAALAGCLVFLGGCASGTQRIDMQAQRYRIEVHLDPANHRLAGRTVMDLVRAEAVADSSGAGSPAAIDLLLHPDLKITEVYAGGARVRRHRRVPPPTETGKDWAPARHRIFLDRAVNALNLSVVYEGTLYQDVAGGETPGEIHNFAMRAHVSTEGVYLADGYWYPQPPEVAGRRPELAEFTLLADPVPGLTLVAGGERDERLESGSGRRGWRSPYPLPGMVLVGGPHDVHEGRHGPIDIRLYLKPAQARHAAVLFEAVHRYLDRYEPLIGPYPAREYAVVDNFFSSGFAFPMFTLLSSAVIDMGARAADTHGYLDHEMLHSWWGNGIHVDPLDGNWCESLTSYATNYYGFVLDGDEEEARRKRRNYVHFLSRTPAEADKPLGSYGRPGGCGRGIAYQKGAAVFHMLARTMGQERFWEAMRAFTGEYVGQYASWEDIRVICERFHGAPLDRFFEQWIRRGGAPRVQVEVAEYDSANQQLRLVISQGEPPFHLDLPVRVHHAGGTMDLNVSVTTVSAEFTLPVDVIPDSVELDPDYHVFRRLNPEWIIPTTASTRSGKVLVSVVPAGEVAESYRELQGIFQSSFGPEGRVAVTSGEIRDGVLADASALILGAAVRDSYIAAFLHAVDCPVRWTAGGFEYEGVAYEDPAHALLLTLRHPGVSGGGITVFFANTEEGLPRAMNVPFYDNSLVIFKDTRPVLRRDLEPRMLIPVARP